MNRYEREKSGTGGWRAAVNRHYNEQCAKHKTNANGWVIPEEVWQGWGYYNLAVHYTYRLRVLGGNRPGSMKAWERASTISSIKIALENMRLCRRPRLP